MLEYLITGVIAVGVIYYLNFFRRKEEAKVLSIDTLNRLKKSEAELAELERKMNESLERFKNKRDEFRRLNGLDISTEDKDKK